jgi:mono/diheme cytochrome c family protein
MRIFLVTVGLSALLFHLAAPAQAEDAKAERGNPQLGFVIAKEHCSRCHAIQKVGTSPLAIAPPFRDLHLRYPVEDLAESLGEGIRTGHPTMPEFRFDPDQIENFIAYLKTLEQ